MITDDRPGGTYEDDCNSGRHLYRATVVDGLEVCNWVLAKGYGTIWVLE